MIITRQEDITRAVLDELSRAHNPRFREIMSAAVRHLHDFAREAKLTEAEFHQACGVIAKLGQLTTVSHNEVVLIAGSLGLSSLVCLLNNGDHGQTDTTANLMGPFGEATRHVQKTALQSFGRRLPARLFSSTHGSAISRVNPWLTRRSTFGIRRRKGSMRIRTPSKPT